MSEYDVSQVQQSGSVAVRDPATLPGVRPRLPDPHGLDRVADVRLDGPSGPVSVFVVFSVDADTNEVRAAVVDDQGRLVRMVPARSVADMLKTMAQYGSR